MINFVCCFGHFIYSGLLKCLPVLNAPYNLKSNDLWECVLASSGYCHNNTWKWFQNNYIVIYKRFYSNLSSSKICYLSRLSCTNKSAPSNWYLGPIMWDGPYPVTLSLDICGHYPQMSENPPLSSFALSWERGLSDWLSHFTMFSVVVFFPDKKNRYLPKLKWTN